MKCQNRSGKLLNPRPQSCTQPSLIKESVKTTMIHNETNLDKQNQKLNKDLKLSCSLPHCLPSSNTSYATYYVLDNKTILTAKRNSIDMSAMHRYEDIDATRMQTLSETAHRSRKHYSKSDPNNAVEILLADSQLSDLIFHENNTSDMQGLCTDHDLLLKHVFCRHDAHPDLLLNKKGTLGASIDFTRLASICQTTTDICHIKQDNVVHFSHSALNSSEEPPKLYLENEQSNQVCCNSCNDDNTTVYSNSLIECKSELGQTAKITLNTTSNDKCCQTAHCIITSNTISNGKFCQTAHDMITSNTISTNKCCKCCLETENCNEEQYTLDNEQDFIEKVDHYETEDTVSTMGSLYSLKLFEMAEIITPALSISDVGIEYENSFSMSEYQTSPAHSAAHIEQLEHPDNLSVNMKLTTCSEQSFQETCHSTDKSHRTLSAGDGNNVTNGNDGDQRCPSAQQVNNGISRAKLKTIKLTLTVVICYILCWAPFFVGQMWAAYDVNAPYDGPFFSIIMLLASVNSCTNPWIYTIFSNTICQRTREIFRAPWECLAACWKIIRSTCLLNNPTSSSGYPQAKNDVPRKSRLFEHTSFSTFG